MKSLYWPVILLTAILAFSLWTGQYVEKRTTHWTAQLEQIAQDARDEDWQSAQNMLQKTHEDWNNDQVFFHTVLVHQELDSAESLFAACFAACEEQDNSQLQVLLSQLTTQLELLAETQAVSVKNVL
jgi:hypothetical protein